MADGSRARRQREGGAHRREAGRRRRRSRRDAEEQEPQREGGAPVTLSPLSGCSKPVPGLTISFCTPPSSCTRQGHRRSAAQREGGWLAAAATAPHPETSGGWRQHPPPPAHRDLHNLSGRVRLAVGVLDVLVCSRGGKGRWCRVSARRQQWAGGLPESRRQAAASAGASLQLPQATRAHWACAVDRPAAALGAPATPTARCSRRRSAAVWKLIALCGRC